MATAIPIAIVPIAIVTIAAVGKAKTVFPTQISCETTIPITTAALAVEVEPRPPTPISCETTIQTTTTTIAAAIAAAIEATNPLPLPLLLLLLLLPLPPIPVAATVPASLPIRTIQIETGITAPNNIIIKSITTTTPTNAHNTATYSCHQRTHRPTTRGRT